MLKAIAFDLWETLITNGPEVSKEHKSLRLQRMGKVLAESGFDISEERIGHAYRASWHRCHDLYWSADRDIPCRTQIDTFLEELGLRIDDERTLEALEDVYARVAVELLPSLVPGAAEVVGMVRERGLSVGLISNTGRTPGYALREILERLGLSSSIDAMVFSNEHGECKPQRSIFESLRRKLDVEFEEMLFVGDNLYVDVHGAQRCGMRAVHFIPPQRGTAVAPDVDHGLEIAADATIRDLGHLPAIIDELSAVRYPLSAQ